MAKDCKKCINFRGMHKTNPNTFHCSMDPTLTCLAYKPKNVCPNYMEENK